MRRLWATAAAVLATAAASPISGAAETGERADVRVRVEIAADGTGSGTIEGTGFNCPGDCTEFVPAGTPVTLTGDPARGSELEWGGACAGTPGDQPCTLTPTGRTRVIGTFTATGDPGPGGDADAPQTTITRAPKAKVRTKRRRARVRFEFESSERRSTFECRLDRRPFERCDSPAVLGAKVGAHTFEVRATDAGGNTDPSPAKAAFRVKRKR